jgi:hypothetical protein
MNEQKRVERDRGLTVTWDWLRNIPVGVDLQLLGSSVKDGGELK